MHCAALLGFVAISNDATGGHACLRNSLLTVDAPAGGAEVDFELADAAFGFFEAELGGVPFGSRGAICGGGEFFFEVDDGLEPMECAALGEEFPQCFELSSFA